MTEANASGHALEIGSRTAGRQHSVQRKEEIEPIGANAGQTTTEPKEKPPIQGVLPLAFFHWRR